MNSLLKFKQYFRNICLYDFAAFGTWLVVAGISISIIIESYPSLQHRLPLIIGLFLIYFISFSGASRRMTNKKLDLQTFSLLAIQLISAFAIMWFIPISFLSILTIIWVAVLPSFLSMSRTIIVTLIVVTSWFSIYSIRWDDSTVVFTALLFSTFHFFTILMAQQTKQSVVATEKALLLSDVRVAVSTIRENNTLDINQMLDVSSELIPNLKIHKQIDVHLGLDDLSLADELIHCIQELITNTVRHSTADQCWVKLIQNDSLLHLNYSDNG